jgi:hypothetical protein
MGRYVCVMCLVGIRRCVNIACVCACDFVCDTSEGVCVFRVSVCEQLYLNDLFLLVHVRKHARVHARALVITLCNALAHLLLKYYDLLVGSVAPSKHAIQGLRALC